MASPVNPPRGMRDFLPNEKRKRESVLSVIRKAYEEHGFEEIETPVVEDAGRLHAGLGGDNEKLAFAVMRRGITDEDLRDAATPLELADLGLRFDLTVPLARFYASHRAELPPVFRAIQIAPVWRAERPQKGRYRQFVQCDIDVLGEPGLHAELELLAATGDALERLGLVGATIRVNDRRILFAILDAASVPAERRDRALITLDKLDKIGKDGVIAELDGDGLDGARIFSIVEELGSGAVPDGLDAGVLDTVRQLIDQHEGVELEFDPTLVRGMGYYTGAIFEIAHPELGYSVGGGGRYDGMIGRFLGQDVPAVGISLGFERLVDLVEIDETSKGETVALIHDRDVQPARLVELKRALIAEGASVRVQRRSKNVGGLIDQLAAAGATSFAFVHADTTFVELDRKPIGS